MPRLHRDRSNETHTHVFREGIRVSAYFFLCWRIHDVPHASSRMGFGRRRSRGCEPGVGWARRIGAESRKRLVAKKELKVWQAME